MNVLITDFWVDLICVFVPLICFFLYWRYHREHSKPTVLPIKSLQGYYSMKLDEFLRVPRIVPLRSRIANDQTWEYTLTREWWLNMRFRSAADLGVECAKIHQKVYTEEESLFVKRCITAGSVVFGYRVPAAVWHCDVHTVEIILYYLDCCVRMPVGAVIQAYEQVRELTAMESTKEQYMRFKEMSEAIAPVMEMIVKITNRPPNISVLYELIQSKAHSTAGVYLNSIDDLKRVLTCVYCVLGIHIPKDYILLDDLSYSWIIGENRFNAKVKLVRV